jgi:periplasmic protein TonB
MDFSAEGEGGRNLTGLSVAVLAHLLLGYALVTGLAQKMVKVLKDPLDVDLLEEHKPQVDKPVPPPPRHAPPPVYVPPPEVVTRGPVVETVTAVVNTPPPVVEEVAAAPAPPPPAPVKAPVVEAPPPPVVVPVAAPVVALGAACPNHIAVRSKVEYPPQAQLRGLNGDVVVELTVLANGDVSGAHVVKSSNPIFDDTAISAVSNHLHCVAQGQEVRVRIPFSFRIDH